MQSVRGVVATSIIVLLRVDIALTPASCASPHPPVPSAVSELRFAGGVVGRSDARASPVMDVLEMHVQEMQRQLDCLLWEVKELESKLRGVIEDKEALEEVLEEVEDEHDKSIAKISILEDQLKNLRDENHRLSDVQKRLWEAKIWESSVVVDIGIPWNSGYAGSDTVLKEISKWDSEKICKARHSMLSKSEQPFNVRNTPEKVGKTLEKVPVMTSMDRRRGTALQQSLFSAFMSVLVGIIVWEAQDACMPLVIALFIVVVMSLNSVVKFFSTIDNRRRPMQLLS